MLNIVIMTGRFTAKPEIRTTANGKNVCNFRIAVERSRKRDVERKTDFFSCTAWNKTAEAIAEWFDKGELITVIGTLQNDSYETGGEKYLTDQIIVREFHFNGNKKSASSDEDNLAAFDEILNDPEVIF